MSDKFTQIMKNAVECFRLLNDNKTYQSELDAMPNRKNELKALIATNAGRIYKLISDNVLLEVETGVEQSKIMTAAMDVICDGKWKFLKTIVLKNRICNCNEELSESKKCTGCDNCTCEEKKQNGFDV